MKLARLVPVTAFTVTAFLGLFHGLGIRQVAAAPAPPLPPTCTPAAISDAAVTGAAKVVPGKTEQVRKVSLGDEIRVTVTRLAELKKACPGADIILYLNDYPIQALTAYPPSPVAVPGEQSSELRFRLRVTDGLRAASGEPTTDRSRHWVPILGSPCCEPRNVSVSVGLKDQVPLRTEGDPSNTTLELDILGNRWFAIWAGVFAVMIAAFVYCVGYTNIIRNGSPRAGWEGITNEGKLIVSAAGIGGTYSLAKTQGAFWFFIIVAAYLLIGFLTGDFSNSINNTALILLGIGAGTVVGSAIIDQSNAADDAVKAPTEIAAAKAELARIDAEIAAASASGATATPEDLAALRAAKRRAISNYRKLTRQNENFLTDILSDANGVSFHRFQMAAWTLVLGIVFIKGVYENLAMPEFNTTLMGLLGLSAGTYLGLKIPEATTPKT